MDFETIYDVVRENRASIERESERLKTRATLNEAIEALLEEYETLKSQNNEMAQEIASANKQLDALTLKNEKLQSENDELKTERDLLKLQLGELGKMANKVASKTEHEDLIHALRVYMNLSKRKTAKKRGYIKMAILELVAAASVILPEDMKNELETFDDDMQQQQVNVQAGGIYVQQADTVA